MKLRLLAFSSAMTFVVVLAGCGKSESPGSATTAATPAAATQAVAATASPPPPGDGTWTPEALEDLLAPIALYPDVVLGHVLTASTNPQEVLDAGNWLIANQNLSGSALDDAASKLGLSPSVRALLQFPETVDMMCMQMDWTTQLGQAFTADQGAVLDAVQRLRAQAKDVGNLQSGQQLKVETQSQDGKEAITVAPADPKVVYVPQYDPQAVYAPPPASIPPPTNINITPGPGTTMTATTGDGQVSTVTTAPVTTTTTTTTTEDKGHSTGALVTTGLLAFGAGILVNEVFDDDDDWDNYYPNYSHGGMYYGGRPYYPPPPYMYRPPYGSGYYPANNYNRPPNYQHGFNNNTIVVNNGGNDYWNRYGQGGNDLQKRSAHSPISAAKPNRPELNNLNRQASERTQQARQRTASNNPPGQARDAGANLPQKSGYAGARPENKEARERMVQNSPKPGVPADMPKRPQGSYAGSAGSKDRPAAGQRPAAAPRPSMPTPATREAPKQRPAGTADRGRDTTPARPASRPEAARPNVKKPERPAAPVARPPMERQAPAQRPNNSAFNADKARPAKAEHAAAQRGRESKPAGARGGGKKPGR